MELVAEGVEVNAAKRGRVGAEAAQGTGEQGVGAGGVASLKVVEGGGDLNEGLEEVLLGLRECEPDRLPVFVGEKELATAVAGEAIGEGSASPIEGHGTIIVDPNGIGAVLPPFCCLRIVFEYTQTQEGSQLPCISILKVDGVPRRRVRVQPCVLCGAAGAWA